MGGLIAKRIFSSLLLLFGVSLLLYCLMRMMPTDFVSSITNGNPSITPEMVESLRRAYGLDKSVLNGYISWVSNAVRLDFGVSFLYKKAVFDVIGDKIWRSFALAFSAFVIQLAIGIPAGINSAVRRGSRSDYFLTLLALLSVSVPSFFFAAVLQKFFSVDSHIFPLQGMVTARYDYEGFRLFLDIAWHFCLPVIVFVITGMGSVIRYTRINMLEVLHKDYIRTARAKGLFESTVIYKHAFRNTLVPLITMLGMSLPSLFSGAIIVEGIFAIDGVGNTAFRAMKSGDIPFVMGFNMLLAVLTIAGNLIAEILCLFYDPRIKLK